MLTKEKLINNGFSLKTYEDQVGRPVFFHKQFDDVKTVSILHNMLGESVAGFDYDLKDICCVLEIGEDMSGGQYLFKEKEYLDGYMAFDALDSSEFDCLFDEIN